MSGAAYVDHLNHSFFSGGLSPDVAERLAALPVDRADVRAFIERMCRLMARAGLGPTDLSPLQGDVLGVLLSRLLPDTWEGRVPPITVAGRHQRIDLMVDRVMAAEGRRAGTLLDVACGFPPVTTVDTANALTGWSITGLDRSLPAYLVHDASGNYAVFGGDGRATYFQPLVPSAEAWTALLVDWHATRRRFESLLMTLLEERTRRSSDADRFEHEGATLETNPVRAFERPNLRFVQSDLGTAQQDAADVVRCFNMLLYFDDHFRTESMAAFGRLLREGGLLVCGTDWAHTTESRYFTYRKRGGRLQDGEFAFSLDNVTPIAIIPWYTLHDDDREVLLLAELTGILRSNRPFRENLMAATDALRAEHGVCPRRPDGYYDGIAEGLPQADLWNRVGAIADHLCDHELGHQAVAVLQSAGWRARMNEVGHVAVAVGD
jgi:hypothetical protein